MQAPSLRYQPLGPVLAGEGSRAFLALEVATDGVARPVVIVWVPDDAASKPEVLGRIRRETEHAATLDHPHILKVHGLADIDEGHARVVEFADGESLRKVLEITRRLPVRYAARIAADVAMGVHFAHMAGNDDGSPLVHGDLRPETVIVSFRGVAKVSGYGALGVAPKELYGNRAIGRRMHCAPEQVIGGRDNLLPQTDVYLLGLLLHECITGAVPFAFESDFDQAVLTQPTPPLAPADAPAALSKVIEKATAKRAPDRYPTPLAFRDAVESAMDGLPSHEDLAAYLLEHFPESYPSRAARRREIDAGIAELARRQWAQVSEARRAAPRTVTPPPAPRAANGAAAVSGQAPGRPVAPSTGGIPASPVAPLDASPTVVVESGLVETASTPVPPAPVASPKATPKAAAPAATVAGSRRGDTGRNAPLRPSLAEVPPPPSEVHAAPRRPQTAIAAAVGAGVLLIAALAFVVRGSGADRKQTPPQVIAAPAAAAPAPALAVPATADTSAAAAPAPVTPPVPVDPPKPAVVVAPPPAPVPPSLDLVVDPAVEVLIGDVSYGRSPVTMPLPAGRHVLKLVDRSRGINLSRTVVVAPNGKTSERISLSRGFVTISAPDGAEVFIDGRSRGRAPLAGELSVYEGNHKILVTVGKARWQQSFSLRASERMYFNVETQ